MRILRCAKFFLFPYFNIFLSNNNNILLYCYCFSIIFCSFAIYETDNCMKTIRIVSTVLFYLTRVLSIGYILIFLYCLFIFSFNALLDVSWLPIQIEEGRFTIFYPFTETSFLLGYSHGEYIIFMLMMLAAYGAFLWLLGNIFRTFKQQKLFTQQGVKALVWFSRSNLLVPIFMMIWMSVYLELENGEAVLAFLHVIVGIFAWFMEAIFRQGLSLQEDSDLTI